MSLDDKNIKCLEGKLVVFQDSQIRRIFHKGEWYFSILDVIRILASTSNPRRYWPELKKQLINKEGFAQLLGKIEQLKLESADGKKYLTDTANTETMFRIIQSIPSPKAEPFKRWLAKVGNERVLEIDDPELATQRTRAIYKAKGYSDEWIERRMRGIAIREELTDEWDKRGIKIQREYAILTAEISKATFGMTPSEYKIHKGLRHENLRDHMTDLEQIFSMLGEAATKEILVNQNAQGFEENKTAAKTGGRIAGDARQKLEQESGKPVISKENFLRMISEIVEIEVLDEELKTKKVPKITK